MTPSDTTIIEDAHYARVYARNPITLVSGKGAIVYDAAGRQYVDLAGGYGTCIVGHAHPRVSDAIAKQASMLISCHSSAYNDARASFILKLTQILPYHLNRIFLSNSGAEAVECSIKVARKHTKRRKIVAIKNGYHGKTYGALSATWDSKYRKNFEPLVSDFTHIPFNNQEVAKEAISRDTAAVIVEPIQGEGGIRVAAKEWISLLADLAIDAGALLIADEIQSGFGRTGKMFASDHFDIEPDIVCLGKGIASGLPVGVTAAPDAVMGSLEVGEHTSTFGGNPVVCAAGSATIDVLRDENLVERAAVEGEYFREELLKVQRECRVVREIRGLGLMLAAELRFDVHSIVLSALQEGILMLNAGRNVLRFLPPLCIERAQVDRTVDTLRGILEREEIAKFSSATVAKNA